MAICGVGPAWEIRNDTIMRTLMRRLPWLFIIIVIIKIRYAIKMHQ